MLALGSLVAMSATVPVLVALVQPMLDSVVAEKNLELMQLIVLAVIGLFAMRSVAGHIAAYTTNWVGSKMAMDMRVEMFDKLLMLPARYFAGRPDAAVFAVITSGATRLAEAFTAAVTVLVKDTFTIVGLLGWMFYIDWILALAALSVSARSLADHAIDRKAVAGNNMGSWSNNGWPVQSPGGICGALPGGQALRCRGI